MPSIVGDAVQDRLAVDSVLQGQQPGEVNPRDYVAVRRRYTRDPVGMPNVRIDLTLDEFQFIQLVHNNRTIVNFNRTTRLESLRVAKDKLR